MQKECPAAQFGGMTSNNNGGACGCPIAKMAGPEAAALWDTHAGQHWFTDRPGAHGDL